MMRNNDVLNNFKNVREYILLLPIQEQIKEINKVINYHTSYKYPFHEIKSKYAIMNQFKDFKKLLVRYHIQELCSNPLKFKDTLSLYTILQQ